MGLFLDTGSRADPGWFTGSGIVPLPELNFPF